MNSYRIVVGIDGSEGGQRALSWAVAEAARRGGTVQALIGWHRDHLDGTVIIANENSRSEAYARQILTESIAAARGEQPDVEITGDAVQGDPVKTLTRAAADADLLVLGSHGHGRFFHAVLGSIVDACIHEAACPVVVVPSPQPQRDKPAEAEESEPYLPAGIL